MTWLYVPPFLTVTCRSGRLALVVFAAVYGGLWLTHAALRILFP
jgi:hypothetical protein